MKMADLKSPQQPSEAEQFVLSVAATIGLTKESTSSSSSSSEILLTVCRNMKQEFLVATWQLSVLDVPQWQQLGAPMGLAAAVKYHLSSSSSPKEKLRSEETTALSRSPPPPSLDDEPVLPPLIQRSSPSTTSQPDSASVVSREEVEGEENTMEASTVLPSEQVVGDTVEKENQNAIEILDNPGPKVELLQETNIILESAMVEHDFKDPAPLQTPDVVAIETTEESTALVQESDTAAEAVASIESDAAVQESDMNAAAAAASQEPAVSLEESDMAATVAAESEPPTVDDVSQRDMTPNCSNVGGSAEVLKVGKDLVNADNSCDTTESTDDEDDEDEASRSGGILVQKLDIDNVFAGESPQSSTDEDDGIPRIAMVGSSDDEEDNDPAKVAELVGSLDQRESRLWLDHDCKENDDEVTVVVSNVSPERKSAVKKEMAKKRAIKVPTGIAETSTFESEAVALQDILELLPDKDHRSILSQLMIMTNARGQIPRIKLALQVKDALLASMEENHVESNAEDAVRLIFHLARLKKQYRVMFGRSLFKAMSKLYKREEKEKERNSRRKKTGLSRKSSMPSLTESPEETSPHSPHSVPDEDQSSFETTIVSVGRERLPSF